MIALLTKVFVERFGASQRVAGIGAWVLLIGVLVALLSIGKCAYDRNVIEGHDAEVRAETSEADRAADTNAAETRAVDVERQQQEGQELSKINATVQDPRARRRAMLRCIELQRQARAAGSEPPACT